MKQQRQFWPTLGLIFITFLAAIQYVFLQNVPDTVSTFSFICITNVIGMLILGIAQIKRIVHIGKGTLKKGVFLALELTGMNFFILLGSRHLDAVIISSVVSLYFVFITPMLLLLRRKINFFSGIATVIAIIALQLMFGANLDRMFSSIDVAYLILADVFFAAYVVSVSILGEGEDTIQLTFSQMLFSSGFAFVGWVVENAISGQSLSLPTEPNFWISALFIGIFIRAVYGLIQIGSQKHVSALKASLIFASEILITLLINPVMCALLHIEYMPVTGFQVIGGLLFVVATLMVDDDFMMRLGYEDLKEKTYVNAAGETVERSSVSKKIISVTLLFSLLTLILSTVIFLSSIYFIRGSAIHNSKELGEKASEESADALMQQLEQKIRDQAEDKTLLAAQKLESYSDSVQMAASYAHTLVSNAGVYPDHEVQPPRVENAGKWVMQRGLANDAISYASLQAESSLIGNMEEIFAPIIANSTNITTIYLGTESGLMVSYDPYSSDMGDTEGELYYEFRESSWYKLAKSARGYAFTETYQDGYGRGLTITCVAPFTDAAGNFYGCVAMDILMGDLNASMVNDSIIIPSYAILIDREGNYIAGKNVDPNAENAGNIFDDNGDASLRLVGKEILTRRKGVVSTGEGEDALYIAFSTIESTEWILCILSPVSTVLQPAVTIRDSIDENTEDVVNTVIRGIMKAIQSCLVLSALILIFVTLFAGKVSKRIYDPLKRLEADVQSISGGNLDIRTNVTTDDEIGSLADSFNLMTDSLQKYIADLKEATAKEQRMAGELSAATSIQLGMLPRNPEEFSRGRPFKLYASMDPAKEVGGDFYDYFMTDDNHLCLVMADVCGKGVPAALFMAIAKTLIKNRAKMGGTTGEILTDVNAQLCAENEGGMFVTVWMAIVEVSTGKGIASNAGHEHPVLRRAGGSYELVKYRHSPVVAFMDGIRFEEHPFQLFPGDRIFVYTDGAAEATNAAEEQYGTERMVDALNRAGEQSPQETLLTLKRSIDDFVGSASQFDDITMLCLEYSGTEAE